MRGASRLALAAVQERYDRQTAQADDAARTEQANALLAVARLLDRQRHLARSLADPGIAADTRRGLVDAVFTGKVPGPVLEVLRDVVAQRWSASVDLIDAVELLGAQAAFAVAENDGTLDDVEDELFRFARIIDGAPDLRAALGSPTTPPEVKQALVHSLLEGKVSPMTALLAESAVLAPRGRPVDRAIDDLAAQAAARRQRQIAIVRTAVPLTDDQRSKLTTAIGKAIGRDVRVQQQIDPGILGGVVVRVGDEMLDGSIAHRLAQAAARLTR